MTQWKLEFGQEYDPEKFYTRSKDKQGHSSTIRVNIPDYLMANLAELVQSKAIPAYRTREDFVRDAIVHRFAWVTEQLQQTTLAARFAAERQRLAMIDEASRRIAELEEHEEMLAALESVCDRYYRQLSWQALLDYLQLQESVAESLSADHREAFEKVCVRYWGLLPQDVRQGQIFWAKGAGV